LHNPAYLISGKTIVGALAGGLLTVELVKRYIGLHQSTGDLYAIPLALGIAIGRIGCFLTGLSDNTYGTPTNLPWAINFGDGIPRHPTQLYELVFLLFLIPVLYKIVRQTNRRESERTMWRQPPSAVRSSEARQFLQAARETTRGPTRLLPGDVFKLFMVSYLSFRLLCDFIKPYPRLFLRLGGIQWVCLLLLLYYYPDIVRWLRPTRTKAALSA
jgi:prolipoprotein diacylglyceryltransferase